MKRTKYTAKKIRRQLRQKAFDEWHAVMDRFNRENHNRWWQSDVKDFYTILPDKVFLASLTNPEDPRVAVCLTSSSAIIRELAAARIKLLKALAQIEENYKKGKLKCTK